MPEQTPSAQSERDPAIVVLWHGFATESRGDGWRCVWIGDDLDQALVESRRERPAYEPGECKVFLLRDL